MGTSERLQVRVNADLVLDAGSCEEIPGQHGPERLIRPPEETLFHQVLAYLKAKPDPPKPPSGSMAGREGVAAAALTLRWGSYLAVLLDHGKPICPEVQSPSASRISQMEMARINIEASAALAEWIDLYRQDEKLYARLVDRTLVYLPMPRKNSTARITPFAYLSDLEVAARLTEAAGSELLTRVRGEAERCPSRLFAALVNVAWRNGPVEYIHEGNLQGYPLDQRRMTPAEERELMRFASDGLALGMTVCLQLALEQPRRPGPSRCCRTAWPRCCSSRPRGGRSRRPRE